MRDRHFQVGEYLDTSLLLERFLADCQALSEELVDEAYSFTYVADTIAAIYYHRAYESVEDFIHENNEHLDAERSEWIRYMWRTFDSMTEGQRANIVIESLTQLPVVF